MHSLNFSEDELIGYVDDNEPAEAYEIACDFCEMVIMPLKIALSEHQELSEVTLSIKSDEYGTCNHYTINGVIANLPRQINISELLDFCVFESVIHHFGLIIDFENGEAKFKMFR